MIKISSKFLIYIVMSTITLQEYQTKIQLVYEEKK
jgi:hypothetical protein